MDEKELKELLLAKSAEFRRIFEEHQEHEKELDQLKAKSFLTEAEKIKEKELKKQKLALKDKMYLMMQDFRKSL